MEPDQSARDRELLSRKADIRLPSAEGERGLPRDLYGVRIAVSNEELVTVRDAMRGLNRMVAQLQRREREQFVLMHRGRMVARLVPIAPDQEQSKCPESTSS